MPTRNSGGRPPRAAVQAAFDTYRKNSRQGHERALLRATDKARRSGLSALRGEMTAAGLSRLGQAVGSTSDLAEGLGVHGRGDGFSASGMVYVRSGSKRSRGALRSYWYGAEITPKRGRWLWFPTDEAGRVVGSGSSRQRLTPEIYRQMGEPMGPLIRIRSINGNPLLAVKSVGKSEVGARGGRVRSLLKSGRPRKGDRLKQIAVLFVGIPRTSRQARVDAEATLNQARAALPALVADELRKEGRS